MSAIDLRMAWNAVSARYQKIHQRSTESATYGPWAPSENELRLLGDVRGQKILEIGCGGGQSCIAFARQGAVVAGIDLSEMQLAHARHLATTEGAAVEFIQGNGEDLSHFADGAWDSVFSSYTFPYVADIPRCLNECARVLRPRGRLIFSLDHPFRDGFFDEDENELVPYPVRDYFDHSPLRWTFDATGVRMHSNHHTLSAWLDMLAAAGFRLVRLLEPAPPQDLLDNLWPGDDPRAPLRHLPHCVIFVTERQ